MSNNFWLFQGGPETEWLLEEDSPFKRFFWTANKNVKKGEIAFIYLTAPLSRIMATVRIVGDPFFNSGETSMFDNPFMNDKWCVEVGETVYLGSHDELSIANLRKLFSVDWGWVRYPRGSTRIPDDVVYPLSELMAPWLPKLSLSVTVEGGENNEVEAVQWTKSDLAEVAR